MTPAAFANVARGLLLHGPARLAAVCVPFSQAAVESGAFDAPLEPAVFRASGGVTSHVGPGVLALAWRIPRDGTLSPEKLLNRACRPLMQWLKGMKVPVAYLGRDSLTVPDGEVARLGVTGTPDAFLVEARFAHSASLEIPGEAPLVWSKPGDRKPSRTLVSASRHVPADVEGLMGGLHAALQDGGVEMLQPADVTPQERTPIDATGLCAGVACPLGMVRANAHGRVVGPFMASHALTDDVERGIRMHGNAARAVLDAMATQGAFVVGADPEHLLAALQAALA